tara:strand:- start:3 stop:158 length:156 start_codon:yes stop_codon:yes gene_type:complete
MKEEVNKILEIIKNNDVKVQQTILLECASRIGSKEWQEDIKKLIKRMDKIK